MAKLLVILQKTSSPAPIFQRQISHASNLIVNFPPEYSVPDRHNVPNVVGFRHGSSQPSSNCYQYSHHQTGNLNVNYEVIESDSMSVITGLSIRSKWAPMDLGGFQNRAAQALVPAQPSSPWTISTHQRPVLLAPTAALHPRQTLLHAARCPPSQQASDDTTPPSSRGRNRPPIPPLNPCCAAATPPHRPSSQPLQPPAAPPAAPPAEQAWPGDALLLLAAAAAAAEFEADTQSSDGGCCGGQEGGPDPFAADWAFW